MIDAVLGAVIAVTATTALLLAVQVGVSLNGAGRAPLLDSELQILRDANTTRSGSSTACS